MAWVIEHNITTADKFSVLFTDPLCACLHKDPLSANYFPSDKEFTTILDSCELFHVHTV